MAKNYELIEHTADIGIKIKGGSLKELFINAAEAMFDIIAQKKSASPIQKTAFQIQQEAANPEELLINWLNELLSLSAVKQAVIADFSFSHIDEASLKAKASGYDMKDYQINTEIKAATYHELIVEQTAEGWQAQIIFDV